MAIRYGEERVRTTQYTLVVDRLRSRFCRLPSGADPDDPSLPMGWLPYYSLWRDSRTGALTITLDSSGTRRLRVCPALATGSW
jgi:hypothetical protein